MDTKVTLKENLSELQELAKERTVKTQNIEYDLETLVKKIQKGIIKLNPDYQRNHRWDNQESSKLIESLILNIPIPTIYLSQDVDVDEEVEDGVSRYSVIDGQQRLTAIYGFMKNTYALEGLEVLQPLNEAYYKDLPPFLVRRLEERTIKCLRIDSTVDPQVKYDVFERLNSGAVQLESQELRNAVYRGKFNDLIKSLAKNEKFMKLLNINIKHVSEDNKVKKMQNVEYVLRFFAFDNYEIANMKKSLKKFLSDQMDKFNSFDDKKLKKMSEHFLSVIDYIYDNMGEKAFAKYKVEDGKLKLQSKFNAAVYDALIIAVSEGMREGTLKFSSQTQNKILDLYKNPKFILPSRNYLIILALITNIISRKSEEIYICINSCLVAVYDCERPKDYAWLLCHARRRAV
mgnify:CR=1 FL=1